MSQDVTAAAMELVIVPSRMDVKITKRKPRKVKITVHFDVECEGNIKVGPLLKGMCHYAKLLAQEVSSGLWSKS